MNEGSSTGLRVFVDRLLDMMASVRSSLDQATVALLEVDLEQAELVIDGCAGMEAYLRTLDDHAVKLAPCQPPVPAEVRSVVAGLGIGMDLQHMGKLVRHIAELARARYPRPAVPVELRPAIRLISQAARRVVTQAREAIATADADAAARLAQADDEIDRLHDSLLRRLFDGTWQHGVDAAVDVALIGNYYERYAEHAVAVANRAAVLTGHAHVDGREAPSPAHPR